MQVYKRQFHSLGSCRPACQNGCYSEQRKSGYMRFRVSMVPTTWLHPNQFKWRDRIGLLENVIDSGCFCIGSGAVALETLAWTRRRIGRQQKLDGASRRTQYHAAADQKPTTRQSIDVSKHKSHRTQYHASYDGRDTVATVVFKWPAWMSDKVGLGKRARY